jgi:hypothetical protein
MGHRRRKIEIKNVKKLQAATPLLVRQRVEDNAFHHF